MNINNVGRSENTRFAASDLQNMKVRSTGLPPYGCLELIPRIKEVIRQVTRQELPLGDFTSQNLFFELPNI